MMNSMITRGENDPQNENPGNASLSTLVELAVQHRDNIFDEDQEKQ